MDTCIINVGIGDWYPKGTKRLERSLIYHGFDGEILTWINKFPNNNYDKSNLYNVKASALEEAISLGYTQILWADCSMWAIKPPKEIFDIINDEGIYIETNGYNCAQECSDNCLKYFSVSRDEAEKMSMCSSGMFAVNINNPIGKEFADLWIKSAKEGVWNGSRLKDNQSQDSRFLHHRQDQSAASIILNKLNVKMRNLGTMFNYYESKETDKTIFLCRGL